MFLTWILNIDYIEFELVLKENKWEFASRKGSTTPFA